MLEINDVVLYGIVLCKLRLFDHKIATTAYVMMTRTELFAPSTCRIQCVFSKIFFSLMIHTSKVMYRHEIICTINMASLTINYLFANKFGNKANWQGYAPLS